MEAWLQPGVQASYQKLQHLTVSASQSDELTHPSLPLDFSPFKLVGYFGRAALLVAHGETPT